MVEITAAGLLAIPRTRRIGGWVALATLLAVHPADIDATLDRGVRQMDPPFDPAAAAWLRLPYQRPLLRLAWRGARQRVEAA